MNDVKIRASSFPTLTDCPARWEAINIEGLDTPSRGPAHLGTSLHYAAAAFDQSWLEEKPITAFDAIDLVHHVLDNPEEEVVWDKDLSRQKAHNIAAPLVISYCEDVALNETFEAVELKCEPIDIRMDNGVVITLTGQVDRVRLGGEDFAKPLRGISDLKSGKTIVTNGEVNIDKHVAQLGTYELLEILAKKATGQEMVLPAQVIALPTSGTDRKVLTTTVDLPSKVLLGDGKRKGLLDVVAGMAKNELWPGNPRSMLCSEKYCPKHATCFWRGK